MAQKHPSIVKPAIAGLTAVIAAFGSLALWSVLAPIASAAIAPGVVTVQGSRKTIQHTDGGVVREILVQDGDRVELDQALLTFDTTRLDNTVQTLRSLLAIKIAQKARLSAERDGAADVEFPTQPTYSVDLASFPQATVEQRKLFIARREALEARVAATLGEGEQSAEASKGLRQQFLAQERRLNLTEAELRTAQELAKTGSGTLRRVLEVSRVVADIQGDLAGLSARAAEAERKVDSASLEARRVRTAFQEGVESEFVENTREQLDIAERLLNAHDQLKRSRLLAPTAGQVVSLLVHTVGAVVAPGVPLLDIVPDDDPLIIEAQVKPADVGRVKVGFPVEVRIVGMDGGRLPRLMGTVTMVSADRLTDRSRTNSFFAVHVKLSGETSEALGERKLRAGMGVNVMILQEERTVLQYLVDPTLSFFSQAMRD